jgi:iron complex outermembrane receptor protein
MNRKYEIGKSRLMAAALRAALVCAAASAACPVSSAQSLNPAVAGPNDSLTALSLEELTRVQVTSVARKDQKLLKVAAAVYVITADEIRRSGATSVPDVLRVVPGIEVAQINANVWAISARGFNGRGANKVLVLVDGRSIYNSLYSGTFWDQNQVPLENIERIEVIRGPGATMWGANAVDGVISIITKKAKDTQGFMVSVEAGRNSLPDADIRYGGHEGQNFQYRLDGRFQESLALVTAAGSPAGDRWSSGQAGGRADWKIDDRDTLTADGQIYTGGGRDQINPVYPLPSSFSSGSTFDLSGGFFRSRWERQLDRSDLALEVSYTREGRSESLAHGTLNTVDIDFQHHLLLGRRNDFNWGGGYRFRADDVMGLVSTPHSTESLFSIFAQDEFSLVPAKLSITGGIKLQDFLNGSGNSPEVQPQGRILWTPNKTSSLWAAVSRAIRTPSEIEREISLSFALPNQNGIPASGAIAGDPYLPGEVVIAYEAGYRHQFGKRFSIDVAGFYNHYTRLIESVQLQPYIAFTPGPVIMVPETYASTGAADTHGVELAASWSPRRNWRLQLSYAWESASFQALPNVALIQPPGAIWATPAHVVSARSAWDVTRRWSFDSSLYTASQITQQAIPAYARVDVRIARKLGEGSEFSCGVQNLFDERHLEFRSEDNLISSYMRRNAFAKMVWRF